MASALKKSDPDLFAYFGFGSLVNRKTLSPDIVDAIPVALKGWRRHWQARPDEPMQTTAVKSIALLSIHRDEKCEIDGLLIIDRLKNLPALDKRESHYHKQILTNEDFSRGNLGLNKYAHLRVHTYVSTARYSETQNVTLLRSYLDVVMQGFLGEYGEAGVRHFVETTSGFNLQIHEDRERPVYPRHQGVSAANAKLFDKILRDHTGAKSEGVYNRTFNGF